MLGMKRTETETETEAEAEKGYRDRDRDRETEKGYSDDREADEDSCVIAGISFGKKKIVGMELP